MTPDKPLAKWTVAELKTELKKRDLPLNGIKAELMARLQEAMDGDTAGANNSAEPTEDQTAQLAEGDDQQQQQHVDEAPQQAAAEETAVEGAPDGEHSAHQDQDQAGAVDTAAAAAEEGSQPEAAAAASQEDAAAAQEEQAPAEPEHEHDYGPEEWELMEIPEDWLPAPIVRLRNVPESSTSDDVKEALEKCGVSVRSITFEPEKKDSKQVAIVRFPPLPLPWTLTEEDLATPLFGRQEADKQGEEHAGKQGEEHAAEAKTEEAAAEDAAKPAAEGEVATDATAMATDDTPTKAAEPAGDGAAAADDGKPAKSPQAKLAAMLAKTQKQHQLEDGRRDGDAVKMARFIASHLADRQLQIGGVAPSIDAVPLPVTLFLSNISLETTDEELRSTMEQYGSLERCFIMRTADGASKGYGFAEFSLPSGSIKAKEAMEDAFKKANSEYQAKRLAFARTRAQAKQPAKAEGAKAATAVPGAKEPTDKVKEEVKAEGGPSETVAAAEGDVKEEGKEKGEEAAEAKPEPEDSKPETAAAVDDAKDEEMHDAEGKGEATAAAEEAAQPASAVEEEEPTPPKLMRAEPMHLRTVYSLFARSLFISNLPQGKFEHEKELKAALEEYGPLSSFTIVRHGGMCKGFGFVDFKRSDHAAAAIRAMENHSDPAFSKLLYAFQNPAKTGGRSAGAGGRGGRGSPYQQGRGAGGRGSPLYAYGRGAGYGRGGMAGMYGNRAVMGPMYGGRGQGGYGYAQAYRQGPAGGRGAGGYGAGGYGMSAYGAARAGYAGGRGMGYGNAAGGYAQRGGYGMQQAGGYGAGGYGTRTGGGYGYAAAPTQGYGAQAGYNAGAGGYRAQPQAQTGYAVAQRPQQQPQQQVMGYGAASTAYRAPGGYGAQTGYGAPAATGYAAVAQTPTGYGAPAAATGYAAGNYTQAAGNYAQPAGNYAQAAFAAPAQQQKRPADQTYGAGYAGAGTGYGYQQDFKRGRY